MFCTFAEVFRSSRFSRKNNVTMMQAAALVLMPVKMLVRYVPKATPIYAWRKGGEDLAVEPEARDLLADPGGHNVLRVMTGCTVVKNWWGGLQ